MSLRTKATSVPFVLVECSRVVVGVIGLERCSTQFRWCAIMTIKRSSELKRLLQTWLRMIVIMMPIACGKYQTYMLMHATKEQAFLIIRLLNGGESRSFAVPYSSGDHNEYTLIKAFSSIRIVSRETTQV